MNDEGPRTEISIKKSKSDRSIFYKALVPPQSGAPDPTHSSIKLNGVQEKPKNNCIWFIWKVLRGPECVYSAGFIGNPRRSVLLLSARRVAAV